jgi:hypothetical protein
VFIVAKHELNPALIDRVPLARVKHRLKFILARGGGRPMTVAIPGKPASAAQPPAQSIQGGQRDQADSQARDGHEEQHSHQRLTQRAVSAFHRPPSEQRSRTGRARSDGIWPLAAGPLVRSIDGNLARQQPPGQPRHTESTAGIGHVDRRRHAE